MFSTKTVLIGASTWGKEVSRKNSICASKISYSNLMSPKVSYDRVISIKDEEILLNSVLGFLNFRLKHI